LDVVMSLLDEKKTAPKKLIEEIGAEKDDNTVEPVSDEGPSMMEMMMAAQLEAKKPTTLSRKERERNNPKHLVVDLKKDFSVEVLAPSLHTKKLHLLQIQLPRRRKCLPPFHHPALKRLFPQSLRRRQILL
jgi:hypothetical protein